MTNSRLTEVEILEDRFPVCLARFMIRWFCDGANRWTCGERLERCQLFLEPQSLRLLSGLLAERLGRR